MLDESTLEEKDTNLELTGKYLHNVFDIKTTDMIYNIKTFLNEFYKSIKGNNSLPNKEQNLDEMVTFGNNAIIYEIFKYFLHLKSINDQLIYDINELKEKYDQIEIVHKKEINDMKLVFEQKIDEFNQVIKNLTTANDEEINSIKTEINDIKEKEMKTSDENDFLREKEKELQNDINKLKIIISKKEISKIFQKEIFMDTKMFNDLDGETQKDMIDQLYTRNQNSIWLKRIANTLQYLSKIHKNSKNKKQAYIYMMNEKIGIHPDMVDSLYEQGELNSNKFLSLINDFCLVEIAINYPSKNFNKITDIILNLKENLQKKWSISIFISEINSMDHKFLNDEYINSVVIDSSVTSICGDIYKGFFQGCSQLQYVSIPSSVSLIDEFSFTKCYSLKHVIIPSSVIQIGNYAFSECISLQNVIIPSSVVKLGNGVFSYCSSLQKISIPSSVTSIGTNIFSHCNALKIITISSPNCSDEDLHVGQNVKIERL